MQFSVVKIVPVKRDTGWFIKVVDSGGHPHIRTDDVMLDRGILASPRRYSIPVRRYKTRKELRVDVKMYNERNHPTVRLVGGLH